jgi:hypothetical protein
MKYIILLLAIISAVININAQRYEGKPIDVVGEVRNRPDRDPSNRNGGGRDRNENRNSNAKQVTVNGKSFKVSKQAKKELKSFLDEFNLQMGVGKFLPGNVWENATKTQAEKFINERRFDAAKRNNRSDEKMWEGVLDGLRKSGHLNNQVNRSVERQIRKERERANRKPERRGGGDNRP